MTKYFILIIALIAVFLLFNCKTMNYNFSNIANDELNDIFVEKNKNAVIKKSGTVAGIYSQKKTSYKFIYTYDNTSGSYHLTFSTVLDEKIIFDAYEENGVKNYEYFVNNFFTVKIGIIMDQMKYIFNITSELYKLYQTKDDFIVSVDADKNYQKYDSNFNIIKKENYFKNVRYNYKENNIDLSRIEYLDNSNHFYLIF